jgi:chromosome partitioning protein
MKAVALVARKGGAGKSTMAIHLGVLAHAEGLNVAFLDLDPQRSLSNWWQGRQVRPPDLFEADPRRLPAVLSALEVRGYGLLVVDTPPAETFDTALVAAAVDLVLIPLRPSILDIYAAESTAALVLGTRTPALLVLNACSPPNTAGEAPTTAEARRAIEALRVPVADAALAQRMDYIRALNGGEGVTEYAPGSRAAGEMKRLWREVHGVLT